MILPKKILFSFFVVFELTAMKAGTVKTPSSSTAFYQNVEDSQHADGSWRGFSQAVNKQMQQRDDAKKFICEVISASKKHYEQENGSY